MLKILPNVRVSFCTLLFTYSIITAHRAQASSQSTKPLQRASSRMPSLKQRTRYRPILPTLAPAPARNQHPPTHQRRIGERKREQQGTRRPLSDKDNGKDARAREYLEALREEAQLASDEDGEDLKIIDNDDGDEEERMKKERRMPS